MINDIVVNAIFQKQVLKDLLELWLIILYELNNIEKNHEDL